MFEQRYSFHFEAAHELGGNVPDQDHPYARVHGHSFETTLFLSGEQLNERGWLTDFAHVRKAAENVRDTLDHRFLNEIPGLEKPTLEILARFIFDRVKTDLPALSAVEVGRPSLGEVVRFEPKGLGPRR